MSRRLDSYLPSNLAWTAGIGRDCFRRAVPILRGILSPTQIESTPMTLLQELLSRPMPNLHCVDYGLSINPAGRCIDAEAVVRRPSRRPTTLKVFAVLLRG